MKILTDTVEDNDRSVDGITKDRQHNGDKGISHRSPGNRVKGEYHQHVVKKRQNRAACKTDILKPEPDIDQHTYRGYRNRHKGVSSHLRAYGSGNTFCGDQSLIHVKIIHHSLIQGLALRLGKGTCLDHNLIGSHNLGGLHILVPCHFLHNRSHLGINLLDIHILVKGNRCSRTAGELQAVIQHTAF